ncbi:MAG: ABC transporter ATP-binding protein [Pseudomonadales bacterium]|nr:ABC transporter ATP-binding protein [Pseudomonadales bacterium]NRA16339.1 ABC transporter ATP-binding protein [Oceanospirillaceae bacterium]
MAEIHLKGLAHSYSDNPQSSADYAIHEMEHVWHQGGAYALLGPSGCGKSTLLNIISGLIKPSHGSVLFDGVEVNEIATQDRNIAQVFQFPVIYDSMTVYDNLAFPLRNMKVDKDKIDSKVKEVAHTLDLTDILHRRASNLSADAKQKISMGRGLVRDDVSAILFDEPLTVIDPNLKWKLRRQLKQIHERYNITMVYVTHDQLEASTFADKIALMYQGKIVQFGTPRELFENPNHTFVGYFIGSPGMNFLSVEKLASGNGTEFCFDGIALPLDSNQKKILNDSSSSNLKVGIRPEFIQLSAVQHPESLPCEVIHTEDLGTYKIVTVLLGQQKLKIRLGEEQQAPQKTAFATFPSQWLKIYIDEYLVDTNSGDAGDE